MADAIVAGVGRAHDLVVVTCNVKDFASFGVRAAAPEDVCATP